MEPQRFQIRIDPLWQPLLLAGGATKDSSYIEIQDGKVEVRFGFLFQHTFDRKEIAEAVLRDWPLWMGVGWRSNLVDLIGLIGSYRNIVELRLYAPVRVWRLLRCKRIAVSMEEPGKFLEALASS